RGSGKELFLMDWDGHALQPLTSNGSLNLRPDPSPDGHQILYLSYKGGHPALYRRDLYSGSESRLFADNGVTGGRWSPDGSKIAVSHSRDSNDEIYLMARDGKELARLTRSPAIDISPTFSPDGRQIAFVSDRLGSPQIFIMNIDGSEVRRLTTEGGYNVSPHWSPKGDRIVYSRQESKGFQIHIVNIDGSNDLRLTESGRNEHPRWSPDSRLIIFTSTRDNTPAIYVMRADGANQRRISPGSARDSHPVWLSPPRP
ncbi:MAG TPA: Tol-Pal system beta propeller repeat protein TolB, partial [Geobacterales bacterium]|nr:Tol-Pal system beta propeller repeat protein TolB [Geobacterales bacterium]